MLKRKGFRNYFRRETKQWISPADLCFNNSRSYIPCTSEEKWAFSVPHSIDVLMTSGASLKGTLFSTEELNSEKGIYIFLITLKLWELPSLVGPTWIEDCFFQHEINELCLGWYSCFCCLDHWCRSQYEWCGNSSHPESLWKDVMNAVAGPKMSLACMIGFRKQGRCPGRFTQVTQIPRKIVYAKVHICHALYTALVILKDYFSLNIKWCYC